ncbi:MAG: hypothetical protein J0H98_01745 [Solirubrobacterales bacterium]|nr:hypothetical protein [Solirubrobacterales bacterium]
MSWRITEEQLLDLNSFLQRSDDVLVHNCLTRTAQESKLFPVLPYLMMSMIEGYWRYPDQLRRSLEVISPEDVGHRARNVSTLFSRLTAWGMVNYYLNGRSNLIRLGLIGPADNLEDLWLVCDWYTRFAKAYNRTSGHVNALDAGDISPTLEERTLQVFEADAFACDAGLSAAAARFNAIATQYNFLVHCESRSGLHSSGPYRLDGRRLMHVRDFFNLSESTLPWMDEISAEIPFNNLSLVEITDGVSIEVTDWATAYTQPESHQDRVIGVGLYTSDFLSDRYVPVGMGSRRELTDTLNELTDLMTEATRALYRRFSGYSMDQMIEAGILTYYQAPVDVLRMAGLYEQSEWDTIDQRTRRLWTLNNEEYSLDSYIDHFNLAAGKLGAQSEYYLHPISYGVWRRGGGRDDLPRAGRTREFVPADVLVDHDYSLRVNPDGVASVQGDRKLPEKTAGFVTSQGRLTQDEMNRAAAEWSSPLLRQPWRSLDDAAVKWSWQEPETADLYRYTQEGSRLLEGRGAGLLRKDIAEIREAAGEPAWANVSSAAPVAE